MNSFLIRAPRREEIPTLVEMQLGLRLYVEKQNTRAQAVYEKLGMSPEHYHLYEWMKDF